MIPYPDSVQRLIEEFGRLPGIGKRSAERMAFHVLASPRDAALALAVAIRDVKRNLRACADCFNVAEDERCAVCAHPNRDRARLCVVELPRDLVALEKTDAWRGLYHVLQGRLAPADGVGPDQLRLRELLDRLAAAAARGEPFREVLLATSPTAEGDATAALVSSRLHGAGVRVTRLARGLSSGAELENTAPSALTAALDNRRDFGAAAGEDPTAKFP